MIRLSLVTFPSRASFALAALSGRPGGFDTCLVRAFYRVLLCYILGSDKHICFLTGWARYMEWLHNVEIRWTSKKAFKAAGAVEAAATL